jgi:predicted flap endonuclease-1-like 5' DNA nuclease
MAQLAAIPGGPAPADMAVLGWGAFSTLFNVLIAPSFLGKICAIGIIIANFCCALSAVTSTSRMVYAFARDGGLPRFLASVSPEYRTPQAAIWFTGILTFILVLVTTPLGAFVALSTGCAMYLYISYAMPVIAGLFAEGKTWTTFGKFRLGGMSKLFAVIVALGMIGVIIGGHAIVPSVQADAAAGTSFAPGLWYYTIGYLAILGAVWLLFEGKRFQGPPIGEEAIKRRQSEIAAREAELAGGSVYSYSSGSPSGAETSLSVANSKPAAGTSPTMSSSTVSPAPRMAEAPPSPRSEPAKVMSAPMARAAEPKPSPAPKPAKPAARKASAPKPKAKVVDDISMIGGIGPKITKMLAKEGVTSLSDIAKMPAASLAKLDEKLDFRGRSAREEWIDQAKELLAGKPPRAKSDQARKAAKK